MSLNKNRKKPHPPRATTLATQALFLQSYAQIGVVTAAAKMAGIDRSVHYEWMADVEKYPDYKAKFEDAHQQAIDRLEVEAIRRGLSGWEEPVFGRGKDANAGTVQVGTIRRYSDRMLEIMLRARRPADFRERMEVTGKDGGAIKFKSEDLAALSIEDLQAKWATMQSALNEMAGKK